MALEDLLVDNGIKFADALAAKAADYVDHADHEHGGDSQSKRDPTSSISTDTAEGYHSGGSADDNTAAADEDLVDSASPLSTQGIDQYDLKPYNPKNQQTGSRCGVRDSERMRAPGSLGN
jgi:hypothetical protein